MGEKDLIPILHGRPPALNVAAKGSKLTGRLRGRRVAGRIGVEREGDSAESKGRRKPTRQRRSTQCHCLHSCGSQTESVDWRLDNHDEGTRERVLRCLENARGQITACEHFRAVLRGRDDAALDSGELAGQVKYRKHHSTTCRAQDPVTAGLDFPVRPGREVPRATGRSEEHTSELQSRGHLVCRLLLEKKKYSYVPPFFLFDEKQKRSLQ